MKIEKLIVTNDNGEIIEFNIKDGSGIFITEDNQKLVLPCTNDSLNMEVIRNTILRWQ